MEGHIPALVQTIQHKQRQYYQSNQAYACHRRLSAVVFSHAAAVCPIAIFLQNNFCSALRVRVPNNVSLVVVHEWGNVVGRLNTQIIIIWYHRHALPPPFCSSSPQQQSPWGRSLRSSPSWWLYLNDPTKQYAQHLPHRHLSNGSQWWHLNIHPS